MESYEKFSLLLRELDELIDDDLLEKSWQHYETIGQQIILEGEQKSWMACAFYAIVWQSTTMGAQEPVFKYSISKLLDICNLSILEFFEKLNKWAEMVLAKGRLLEHINFLQDNLASSTVVYKNFLKIFRFIFRKPSLPTPNRLQPSSVLDISQIFQLTWIAFISLKPLFANDKADLLNELSLLFCVLESILVDARDLLLADLMLSPEFVMSVEDGVTPLESICKFFEMPYLDAKHFQTYRFLPEIRKLVADGVLQYSLLGNYQSNRAALELLYEEQMKKRVEIDQRILSAKASDEDIFDQIHDAGVIEIFRKSAVELELLRKRYIQKSMEEVDVRSEDNITKSNSMMYVDTRIYVERPDYPSETYKDGFLGIPSGQYKTFAEDNSILDRFGVKRKHEMIL